MIAAFADFQVRVMPRRELDPLRRQQVDERIMRSRQVRVNGVHDLARGVWPGDRQHSGMRRAHKRAALLGSKAAGDDDLAVLGQRFANGRERFLDRGIDETAGVDDDQIGALVGRRDGISLGFEPGKNLFGVDQSLRASQRDESHLGRCGSGERSGPDFGDGH
jgi:hypothetical protein